MSIITPKQRKAISALLRSPTIEKAAAEAGVGYSTLRRWLKEDDEFRREYERELAGLVRDAAGTAKKALNPAMAVLWKIICSKSEPSTTRIQAARVLTESSLKLTEVTDVLARLDELEKNMEEYK